MFNAVTSALFVFIYFIPWGDESWWHPYFDGFYLGMAVFYGLMYLKDNRS